MALKLKFPANLYIHLKLSVICNAAWNMRQFVIAHPISSSVEMRQRIVTFIITGFVCIK